MKRWLLVLVLLTGAGASFADQAQYFYDELGRLVGVVDGQNNAAVYNYDEVGNLLSIQRFSSSGGSVGIFLITPGSSLVNKPVEIRGFGFTSPPASNQVTFNGIVANIVSATSSSLIVSVPSAATTGPVVLTNSNGTTTSPQAFTVLVPPIITAVDPLKVPQGTTTKMFIQGFNLKTTSSVTFTQTGMTATILSGATDATVPINLAVGATVPAGLYAFSLTTPGGTTQSSLVKIEVRSAAPTFDVVPSISVFLPPPAQLGPSGGDSLSNAPATSVFMAEPLGSPQGSSMSVAAPVSAGMP